MNYFKLLRLALAKAYIDGRFTKEQASEIAQRINKEQAEFGVVDGKGNEN